MTQCVNPQRRERSMRLPLISGLCLALTVSCPVFASADADSGDAFSASVEETLRAVEATRTDEEAAALVARLAEQDVSANEEAVKSGQADTQDAEAAKALAAGAKDAGKKKGFRAKLLKA